MKMKRRMIYVVAIAGVLLLGLLAVTMVSRGAYESAEYDLLEVDGNIEIREYPELMLVTTGSDADMQGRDGSFMRLFQYISGENETEQKISMTTPVFMENDPGGVNLSMGFVLPKDVAKNGAPPPSGAGVVVRKRDAGRFAVVRFAGKLDSAVAEKEEARLREWIEARGLDGEPTAEVAGYDPPFTPGFLRRNEVLIRLRETMATE